MTEGYSDLDEMAMALLHKLNNLTVSKKLTWATATTFSSEDPDSISDYGDIVISKFKLLSSWVDGISVNISFEANQETEEERIELLQRFLAIVEKIENKMIDEEPGNKQIKRRKKKRR